MENETNNKFNQMVSKIFPFWRGSMESSPGGNILSGTSTQLDRPVVNQQLVKQFEPFGALPRHIKERSSGWSQIANLSHEFTIQKVQSAFRAAERGDMTLLFGYYRDFFIGNSMVASHLSKRKLSTISEPYSIIPANKKNPNDVIAAKAIKQILDNCPTFEESLVHMMNAIVFPISAVEKTFEEIDSSFGDNPYGLRYKLKQLYPVDYQLITYRLPYLPQGPINIGNQPAVTNLPFMQSMNGRPEDTIFDPDSWEPNIRFWSVFDNGLINYSYAGMMAPDPDRHIIYRCNLLTGIARENFGGLGKAILWWSIMSSMGADVFLRCLQKYGMPMIVAKVDTSQVDTVEKIMEAFGNLNIVNAMAVNKDAIIEIQEMNYSGASDAHAKFLQFCQDQISMLISGETLSSGNSTGGLGSGGNSIQSHVRKDIIAYDQKCLNNSLRHGLFRQLMDINGLKGECPNIVWGGDQVQDMKDLSMTINNLFNAGFEPTPDSVESLSEKLGFTIQKIGSNIVNDGDKTDNNSNDNTDQFDKKEIDMGMQVEKEHTNDTNELKKIVNDHLKEDPNYYTKLKQSGL